MSRRPLTPEPHDEARRVERILMESVRDDLRSIAALFASEADRQLLGRAESEVGGLVHEIGAEALETALDERERGGTSGPR